MRLTPKHDLTGRRFSWLTVVSLAPKEKWKSGKFRCWLCKCDCGKETILRSSHLTHGNTKSCGCQHFKKGKEHQCWKGVGELSKNVFNTIEYSAKLRKIPFNITINEIWKLFLKQHRRCKLTGLEIQFPSTDHNKDGTASLDRVDSSKGYTIDNVQWVHKDVNRMKLEFSTDKLFEYCKLICQHKKLL